MMQVKLISKTEATPELQAEGIRTLGDIIAYTARVSNPGNQFNTKTAPGLIKYLIRENHWSPFEMASMCMEIKTTRDIGRQILRHRSFAFQEFSQRYAEVTSQEWELRETRLQDANNRQASIFTDNELLKAEWMNRQLAVIEKSSLAYQWALENGIAKEQARAVLPEGMTPTTMFMTGTVRSWIHFVKLRSGNGTQLEHQEIAKECVRILKGQGIGPN